MAKKWIYHGEYLGSYPRIYYNVADRFSYQDFALMQILLCMDNFDDATCPEASACGSPFKNLSLNPMDEPKTSIFDFFIENYGVDGQLQDLLEGLKSSNLGKSTFKHY